MKKIIFGLVALIMLIITILTLMTFLKFDKKSDDIFIENSLKVKEDEKNLNENINDSQVENNQEAHLEEINQSDELEENIFTKNNQNVENDYYNLKINDNNNQNFEKSNKYDENAYNDSSEKNSAIDNIDDNKQNNIITTTFYDSITHGKKEFKSESEAIVRGNNIVDNELNYIMDYNEQHMDSQIQPTINYYRVYPSIIDENGECWYYLHFFTTNGENQDEYLKTKF